MKFLTIGGASLVLLSLSNVLAVPLHDDLFPPLVPLVRRGVSGSVVSKGPSSTAGLGSKYSGKFLHITDIHIDKYYKVGSDPDNLCHSGSSSAAGPFGALGTNCDSPQKLVDATFAFLKSKVQDVDFIIYTGDTARHDRDKSLPRTAQDVADAHTAVMKYFTTTYNVKKTPVVLTVGNNDMTNHNEMTADDSMFKTLQKLWSPLGLKFGPSFLEGGYYSQKVIEGLYVINTNSMFFFSKNKDGSQTSCTSGTAQQQIKWIDDQLSAIQQKKGRVYIMGHVPVLDTDGSALYTSSCQTAYINLLGKYGSIIAGHFTGHTNDDIMTAVVSDKGKYKGVLATSGTDMSNASAIMFNAPSVIPVHNPAIRIYSYQVQPGGGVPVGTIIDYDQYYVDLKKANKASTATYELEYTASKVFGIKRFDATGVAEAFKAISSDSSVKKEYKNFINVAG